MNHFRLNKSDLDALLIALREAGYRVIGPTVRDGAVVLAELDRAEQLPLGVIDRQDGGSYRLMADAAAGYFDHVVGPQSLKPYLFPPRETLLQLQRAAGNWQSTVPLVAAPPTAVIGLRSCDLHALRIQDRVFLEGPYQDPGYAARRRAILIVAIQCRRAAATCFCHSMNTGPQATTGFDLALSEFDDHFIVEVGTVSGQAICDRIPSLLPANTTDVARTREQSASTETRMKAAAAARTSPVETSVSASGADIQEPRQRHMNTNNIRELLLNNVHHDRWELVAERCLACANCTMVCPTCFCSAVHEVTDLAGEQVSRERTWDSCFTADHSRTSSGVVRNTTASRYRQWLTHKLATWIDQFDTSGCVGCGRCITWCPVGIDLTEEVAAIRENSR